MNNDRAGQRVRCNYMYDIIDSTGEIDTSAQALRGMCGTVQFVDDWGQIHVKWDNGSTLALNPKTDSYEFINYELI